MKKFHSIFKQNKALATILVIIVVLIVLGVLSSSYMRKDDTNNTVRKAGKSLTSDAAKTLSEEFINKFLLSGGATAKVTEITTEYGLYKLKVDLTSNVVESYITKDGKLFFPQSLVVEEIKGANTDSSAPATGNAAPSTTVTKKSDKPTVELFVMSYCPYGTQIEKGILPVLAALGNKIDFKLKFCSYIMHGDKEIAENLLQYCIQKEQPDKLAPYLKCFLEASQSASCLDSTGVNKTAVNNCVTATDKQFKVTENNINKVGYQGTFPGFDVYKADNEKYNVGGSPTLVINGEDIQSGRDAASLLKTICSAFNTAPKECSTVLSSDSPSAGFGSGTAPASAGAAGCQ